MRAGPSNFLATYGIILALIFDMMLFYTTAKLSIPIRIMARIVISFAIVQIMM